MTLQLDEITVRFADHLVLDRVSLGVNSGEIVGLLGPSGSGKSTLLRVVAGLQRPDSGRVRWDADDLTALPTHRRRVGMMFQDEQLFPHLDVAANVGFGLKMAGLARSSVAIRVRELLELVDLSGFGGRTIGSLSGGEAKRVALARSLAPSPRVLLLDEPLTGLDAELHDRLAGEIRRVLRATGTTAVLVTHDPDEASMVADRSVRLPDLSGR